MTSMIENGLILGPSAHKNALRALLHQTKDELRMVSPYITEAELLNDGKLRRARCITRLSPLDVAAGATSLKALRRLMAIGFRVRSLGDHLHAKVYIFDQAHAVVTSANFTQKGLGFNIEAGLRTPPGGATELSQWFETLWRAATPVSELEIDHCEQQAAKLRQKLNFPPDADGEHEIAVPQKPKGSIEIRKNAQYFLCNTNRRFDPGATCERAMKAAGYAACWTTFSHDKYMKLVRPGDVILMYAKKIGFVGAGVAQDRLQVLSNPKGEGYIAPRGWLDWLDRGNGIPEEWRIPVAWLSWSPAKPLTEVNGKPWHSPQGTFLLVEDSRTAFKGVVKAARKHFGTVLT